MIEKIETKLTELNRIKTIYSILNIPLAAQQKDFDFSCCYEFKYCKKNHNEGGKIRETKSERVARYLSVNKSKSMLLDSVPLGEDKKNYRHIINYKKTSGWLKSAQRSIHKIIVPAFQDVTYLHSTIKEKSYASNGIAHCGGEKYIFAIDLTDFFSQITRDKVYKTVKHGFNINKNTADFYASLLTCPLEKGSKTMVLGQGLPSSPILAFWCNKSLFDYINGLSIKNSIVLTVYVDDITFSSDAPIPQPFIDNILGLFRKNGLKIKRSKTHYYKKGSTKKITGVYINEGRPQISHSKHEEIFIIYKKLVEMIHNQLNTLDEFLTFYGLFLKFSGNFIHLCTVEYSGDFSVKFKKYTHQNYSQLYGLLIHKLNIALDRKDKALPYTIENIKNEYLDKANKMFQAYKKDELNIINRIPSFY